MTEQISQNTLKTKSAWLAVSLSWLIPGTGHFYLGLYLKGLLFLCLIFVLYSACVASAISVNIPTIVSLLILLISLTLLPILACIDVFKKGKKLRGSRNELSENVKDGWLSVFLSILIPGLGHLYIRRFISASLWLFFFVVCAIVRFTQGAWVPLLLIRLLASFHAFILTGRLQPKKNIIFFCVFLAAVLLVRGRLAPAVSMRYFGYLEPIAGGHSMEPTLFLGDVVFVNKFIYSHSKPSVGDIVLISPYNEYKDGPSQCLIKRIVAVGGERVHLSDNILEINGKARIKYIGCSKDTLANIGEPDNSASLYGVTQPYTVPEDMYFVLGDSLSDSCDSRHFGPIPATDIIGRVVKIYWPINRWRSIYNTFEVSKSSESEVNK